MAKAQLPIMLELEAQGFKPKEIAEKMGVSKNAVIGELWRYRQGQVPEPMAVTPKPVLKFPVPQVVIRPENNNTDRLEWERRRDALLKAHDEVGIMHMNDFHDPFHDPDKRDLFFGIAGSFQPQIVVVGSDMFDLPSISRFEQDKDISVDDWQERSREYYWPLIHQLDNLLPNAIFVWIYGNHERRALLDIKASNMPKIGMAYFLETIRCGGRVLYVGRTEHVEIGGLIVAHGDKTGKHAHVPMGMLWPSKTVNFGHIHRHVAGGNAFSNGMLCQDKPFYDDWEYPNAHHGGTSTMTVESRGGGVAWSHHNFVRSASGLWTKYDGAILKANSGLQGLQGVA
jgi:hypothetical protein